MSEAEMRAVAEQVGYLWEAEVVSEVTQLHWLQQSIVRSLSADYQVQETQQFFIPVLLSTQKVAVLCLPEYRSSEHVQLLLEVLAKDYELNQPCLYVLNSTQLLSILRYRDVEQTSKHTLILQESGREHWNQGELFRAFIELVAWGVQHQASDLHIHVYREKAVAEVHYTVSGRYIQPQHFQGIRSEMVLAILAVAWMQIDSGNGAVFDPLIEQQGTLRCEAAGKSVVMRWASLAAEFGPSVCLRLFYTTKHALLRIGDLGYSSAQQAEIDEALLADGGAVLVSGVVGSGKSTALAALLRGLPSWHKLITIEDPVEQVIEGAIQTSLSRDLHSDEHSVFASKLRALKRSAMTDVLLGEIRDVQTGQAFSDLASAGVRVYSTVHAGSAALIPQRLLSDFIGVSAQLLAAPGVLRLLLHQMLLPKLCMTCARPLHRFSDYPKWLPVSLTRQRSFQQWLYHFIEAGGNPQQCLVRNEAGCSVCRQVSMPELAGYQGRTVVAEILNPALNPEWLNAVAIPASNPLTQHSTLSVPLSYVSGSLARVAMEKCNQQQVDPFDAELRIGSWRLHGEQKCG